METILLAISSLNVALGLLLLYLSLRKPTEDLQPPTTTNLVIKPRSATTGVVRPSLTVRQPDQKSKVTHPSPPRSIEDETNEARRAVRARLERR